MPTPLSCYWCRHPDVRLGAPCPGCGVNLEVTVRVGPSNPFTDIYVHSYKEMILAEDKRVFDALESIREFGFR